MSLKHIIKLEKKFTFVQGFGREVEPIALSKFYKKLTGERFEQIATKAIDEARLDEAARVN